MRKDNVFYKMLIILIGALAVYFPQVTSAQSEPEKGLPFITNYSAKTYKALPQTWCVQEDERGMMYFGIQNYILEYDGVKWRKIVFSMSTANVVRSMTKNKSGLIYYGGYGDLGYLEADSLGQTQPKSLLQLIPRENRDFLDVWSAYSTDNGIYFQTREYIFRLSEQKSGNEKREVRVWKPSTKFMYSFYLDNVYYVHQQGVGLYKMVNDSLELIPGSEFLGKERMQIMLPYSHSGGEKQYLIGMFYSGLYVYDGKTFRPFKTAADPFFKSGAILYKGILLRNGNYALGSTGIGLVIIDAQGNLLQRINRDVGLQDESIYGTYEDKKGTLWLALDNGISRVETASSLSQFTLQSGINTGVLAIKRFNNNLYIGTTNGLLQFNKAKSYFDPIPGVPQNQIFSLIADGDKLLVPGDGLFAIKDGKVITIRQSVSADLTVSGLHILESDPDVLVTGGQFGVALFTRKNITTGATGSGTWNFLGYIPGIADQVWNFAQNKDGSIWAGTQNGVVYRLTLTTNDKRVPDPQKTKVEKFGLEAGFRNGLGAVYSIKGAVYFVGDSTLYTFNDKLQRFMPDSTFGNFPNAGLATEFDMVEDSTGRVWIRAGKLTRLAIPKPEGGYSLDDSKLNSITELTIQKFYPEKNGILWVCTTDGLIRFDENIEKNSDQSFKTILRHISAEKAALTTNATARTPSVSYKNNTLRFEYAAPFFEHEDKTRYQTWLEGFEKTWTDLDNNYYKEYTNLPIGKYTFHVRAVNIYGKQSEEATYSFEILPPWYRTWWAYLLYAIVAAVVIYSFVRWRTRQLHEKHRELEKIVADRTKEVSQRAAELAVINSVQEGLAKELDIQGIYDLVGDRIKNLFDAQTVVIRTFDHSTGQEHLRYAIEKGERIYSEPRPLIWANKYLIRSKGSILINKNYLEASKEYGGTGISSAVKGQTPKSAVFVPMIVGDNVRGSVSLQNVDRENAFTESDLRLLTTLTNSMSVALENARLFDETNRLLKETEQRTAELAVINSVQDGLAKELDIQAIYDLVGNKISDVFKTNAQAVIIATLDTETKTEYFNYAIEKGERFYLNPRKYDKLREHLVETKQKILINENFKEAGAKFGMKVLPGTEHPKSLLFVPLVSGDKVKSYVSLQNVDKENAFNEADVRLLETLANSMSVALENARLFDETNRLLKETEQRTAELAVINSVQEGLAKELDIQGIYDLVGDRLCDLFPDTQTLVIRTFDHEAGIEHWHYSKEKGVRQNVQPRPFNWNSKLLIQTKKHLDIRENYVATAMKHGSTGVTAGQPPKSAVFVPMIVGDVVKGSISLQNVDKENAFNDADLRLLTTITNSMSVALENARLFDETNRLLKETEQRTAELAVINSVQEGLVREMNIQAIYDLVGTRICELFDTQTVLIRTFDHRAKEEHWQYAIEKGHRLYSNPRPLIWANKLMIETKQPLLINENYVETAKKHGSPGVSKGLPPKSALFVPMIVGDVVKGSVSLQNVEKENAFTESDLRLLTTLTNSMSVALENARLFDETNRLLGDAKQRANELTTVNHISQALASQLNLDELIKLVGEQLKDLFKANIVYLAILDQKTKTINFPYQYGDNMAPMKLGEGLTSKIILTGQPLLINKDVQELRVQMGIQSIGLPAASYLGVPIPVGEEVIGVLSVQSTEHENVFNDADLRLLTTIAASVGVAIRKAKLFDEIHQAKMEAETARKTAEKANDAKSAFLSTVSHELRTPLTSVLGFAKIIKKRLEEKVFPITDRSDPKTAKTISQINENLDVVVSEGQRLTHLINDVLDLAKIEAGKMEWNMETVSVPEIAERAIAATTSLFEQNHLTLEKNIGAAVGSITGDKDKLIQVMVNLISNAVKFTPKGKVTFNVFEKNNEVIASITDTGIGIAREDHAAVFEQFKQVGDTLTDKPKGTGLGLPICKEIVEHHGGRIWLESELGKGSTFFVAFPTVKSASPKPMHIEDLVRQLKEQVAQSKLNIKDQAASILIVDDDDSIRSLLHQELTDAGYVIDEAKNGKEALTMVRKKRPDLIILDIMMPEMNGFDVAAVLKNDPQTMDIPIIVLSIVQDKTRGFRIGVDRYLTKPIDTGVLFNEIGSLLEQGKSKKKVMIVDEDSTTVNTLTDVLKTRGYLVMESNGNELVENAVANKPDIIIINSLSGKQDVVQSLRFEKGLENVLFLVYN